MNSYHRDTSFSNNRIPVVVAVASAASLLSLSAICAGESPMTAADERSLSAELMFFQEFPVVISASRKEQPITMSSVPTSIVTGDEIRAGGATNLYEALQFQPGIDMLQIDRNRYALGVRGLHEFFSDRTLTLVDGRIADSPVFGGSELLRLPVLMQDIDRVEIVRGPGGAAWGANAFNGVINIITTEPAETTGTMAEASINEFGDHHGFTRWGQHVDRLAWRLSLGYGDHESSEDAVDDDRFQSRDFSRNMRIDSRFDYEIDEDNDWSFGIGVSNIEHGDFEFMNDITRTNAHHQTVRAFSRLEHDFENEAAGYIQWFGNFSKTDWPSIQDNRSLETDLEVQYNVTVANIHDIAFGGNVRRTQIETVDRAPKDVYFQDEPFDEFWSGLFVTDRWHVSPDWILDLQIRGDYYSETRPELDWSGRFTSSYVIGEEDQHVLRIGVARAFRTPLTALREIELTGRSQQVRTITIPIIVARSDGLDNEEIQSLEMGYTGRIAPWLTIRCDGYLQRYRDLIGFGGTVTPAGFVSSSDNFGDARAGGAEIELSGTVKRLTLAVWYAYNDFDPDRRNQPLRAFQPARNKAGFRGVLELPRRCRINVNYRYSDVTVGDPIVRNRFPVLHRLDVTLSRKFSDNRYEWLVGVSDILDDTDFPVLGISNFHDHETPGRTFFTRLTLNF